MGKDWGENWIIRYIPKFHRMFMNKVLLAIIPIVIIGIVAAYAVSPYFTESTIDEALPTGAIIQPAMEKEMNSMMEEEEKMKMMEEEEKMKMMEEEEKMKMMEEEEKMKMMEEEENIIPMSYTGMFVGVGDGIHDAQGDTFTIPLENGNEVLRLENFKATNGPDLYVYLSTDTEASDFIDLGRLKANSGNQNYDLPSDTDLEKYNKVLIWCKAFGVLFGSAELSSN